MRKKFRVTINGRCYRVVEKKLDGEYGRVDYHLDRITIDSTMREKSKEAQAEILLHEAIHIIAPNWKEEKVLRAGKDLARLLVTSGVLNEKEV